MAFHSRTFVKFHEVVQRRYSGDEYRTHVLYSRQSTKLYQNRPSFVEDITKMVYFLLGYALRFSQKDV